MSGPGCKRGHDLCVRGPSGDLGQLGPEVGGQRAAIRGRPLLEGLGHLVRDIADVESRHGNMLAVCKHISGGASNDQNLVCHERWRSR